MKSLSINSKLTNLYTYFSWLFLPLLIYATFDYFPNPIWADSEGYYVYLPGTVIYDGFEANMPLRTPNFFASHEYSNKIYTKYTYGTALMQAPFFFVAHFITTKGWFNINSANNDGYSSAYQKAISLAAVFFCVLGLWFLQRTLDQHFPPFIVIFTLVITLLGTNLYHYTISEPGMSHVYSFSLFAALIFFTPLTIEYPSAKNFAMIGFLISLIILIRPTNIILALYPLFFDVFNGQQLKDRLIFLKKNIYKLPLILFIGILLMLPQLIYWKYITGDWFIYSYGNEGFPYWSSPKLFQVWFSVQNGLFIYSPVMLFSIIGLFMIVRQKLYSSYIITFLFLLASYIFASWWAWWFGGAFGHRCFVEYFVLLAFPLAFFIDCIPRMKRYSGVIVSSVMFLMVLYTFRITYIYFAPWDGPAWNWGKYWRILRDNFFAFLQ